MCTNICFVGCEPSLNKHCCNAFAAMQTYKNTLGSVTQHCSVSCLLRNPKCFEEVQKLPPDSLLSII